MVKNIAISVIRVNMIKALPVQKYICTLPTVFTLSIGTPCVLTIPGLKFEIVHSATS